MPGAFAMPPGGAAMALTAPATGPVTPPAAAVTTADLATLADTPDDAELQPYVTSALTYVEQQCGPLTGGQWRYLVAQTGGYCGRELALPLFPRLQLASIDVVADPAGTDVTTSLLPYEVSWRDGVLAAPYRYAGEWRVTATIARAAVDAASLKLATCIIAKNLWELQRGLTARPAAYDGQSPIPFWAGVPSRAKHIMQGYMPSLVR